MVTAGSTLESPPIGQTITFIRTAADSDGEELQIEAVMGPGSFIPAHRHLRQEESWEVLSGVATFRVARRTIVLGPGETLTVPAGVAHGFRNRTAEPVIVRATLRPALRAEDLFERLFRLGAQGKVNRLGAPGPRTTASLIRGFREEFFYLAGIPVALQRILAGARP